MTTYVNIEKCDIISHYIQVINISKSNEVNVRVDLTEAPKKKKHFYIYQCGKEEDDLAVIGIRRNKTTKSPNGTNTIELDLEEVADTQFQIALYENENDTKSISNVLQIDLPNENNDNTKPNNILSSTIKAIEVDDEKHENIYIYFDYPPKTCANTIKYKIHFINSKKEELCEFTPFIMNKASINLPLSFTITTIITIDEQEYESKTSDIIIIDYGTNIKNEPFSSNPTDMLIEDVIKEQKLESCNPTDDPESNDEKDEIKSMDENKDNELDTIFVDESIEYNLSLISINDDIIQIRLDGPMHEQGCEYYIYMAGKEENKAELIIIVIDAKSDHKIQSIETSALKQCMGNHKSVIIAAYKTARATNAITQYLTIDIPSKVVNEYEAKDAYSIKSIRAIKAGKFVNVYWDYPAQWYEKINYTVNMEGDSQNIEYPPFQTLYSHLPVTISIIATSSVEDDNGLHVDGKKSEAGSFLITTEMIASRKDIEIIPNGKLSHFVQITYIDNEIFHIQLDLSESATKTTIYHLKEKTNLKKIKNITMKVNEKTTTDVMSTRTIPSNECLITIYAENTFSSHVSNIMSFCKYPFEEYPPKENYGYRPKQIDLLKVRKILDKPHNVVYLYWNTPKLSYGKISYIVNVNSNDKQQTPIAQLPFALETQSLPATLTVVTVTKINNLEFKSERSKPIYVDIPPLVRIRYANFKNVDVKYAETYMPIDSIRNISFDKFKIMLINECKLCLIEPKHKDKLKIKAIISNDEKQNITADNFGEFVANYLLNDEITFEAIFLPEKPLLLRNAADTIECRCDLYIPFKVRYEIKLQSNPNSTKKISTQLLPTRDLPKEDFSIRAQYIVTYGNKNEYVEQSEFSEWSSFNASEELDEKQNHNVVMPRCRQERVIWLIVDVAAPKDGTYHCQVGSDNVYFKAFLHQSPEVGSEAFSIHYATIKDPSFHTKSQGVLGLMFSEIGLQPKKTKYLKLKLFKKTKIISKSVNHIVDNGTFFLPEVDHNKKYIYEYIVDATTHNWQSKITNINHSKSRYYDQISTAFTQKLINKVNVTISPSAFLGTMVNFCKFIYKRGFQNNEFMFINKMFQQIVDSLIDIDSKTINNWTDACKPLAAIAISLELKALSVQREIVYPTTEIDHSVLRSLFEQITDPKIFGSMKMILNNIKNIYMHHIHPFKDTCLHSLQKYSGLKHCHYKLWYNLLCAATSDIHEKSTKNTSLKELENINQIKLREIATLDNRLCRQNSSTSLEHEWRRRVMYYEKDLVYKHCIDIINEMKDDVEQIHEFVCKLYPTQIKDALNKDFSRW
eukprot:40770_1